MFAADPAVDGRIHVYEQWATAADLDAHFQHPNFLGMKELLRAYPRGQPDDEAPGRRPGPVYGPDGVPSATYWPAATERARPISCAAGRDPSAELAAQRRPAAEDGLPAPAAGVRPSLLGVDR